MLLGSSPIASPRFLHKHAGSEDPSLRQRYPVSTVLRSSPTPVRPAVLATALGPTRPRQVSPDNPHCLANVPCPLPRRIGSGAYARFPSLFRSAFPVAQAGRHPHHYFRGLLRLHSRYGPLARSAAQRRPLSQGSSPPGHPNKPLVSYSIKPATIEVESSSTGNTRLRGALCNPCESEKFSYQIDGVSVSDFVFPAWFEEFRAPGSTRFDHGSHITRPYEILPGGYAVVFDANSGIGWRTLFSSAQ